MNPDKYGRFWPTVTPAERCSICGQPDNCGDCTHDKLPHNDASSMGAVEHLTISKRSFDLLQINATTKLSLEQELGNGDVVIAVDPIVKWFFRDTDPNEVIGRLGAAKAN